MQNTSFPSRDSMYCAMARRSPASRAARRLAIAHGDFARDRAALAGALSRASFACHVPTAGDATSTNQKYGGPPCRSRDFAATVPSGAISESSPSSGFSAAKTTRKGAPFHGAIGENKTASSAASSQLPAGAFACEPTAENRKTKNAPAISNHAVTAAANWRARNN